MLKVTLSLIMAMAFTGSLSAQVAQNQTEKGSLTNPTTAGSLQGGKPSAGSLSGGAPAAGSIPLSKPSAGSIPLGKPSAGSFGSGVAGGSLAAPAGERISGATARRSQSADDGTSYTRKPREQRTRRY